MEKRAILAVVLSALVLITWSMLAPKTPPLSSVEAPVSVVQSVVSHPLEVVDDKNNLPTESLINYTGDDFDIVFDEARAAIKDIVFKEYQSYKFSLLAGLMIDNNWVFKKDLIMPGKAVFRYTDKDKEIVKSFNFSNTKYYIELDIEARNLSNNILNIRLPLTLGVLDFGINQNQSRFQDITVSVPDKILRPNAQKEQIFNSLKFIGLRDRYFCAILEPAQDEYSGIIKKYDAKKSIIKIESAELVIAPGQTLQKKFYIYLGPQQLKFISAAKNNWAAIVNYGTFDIVSQVLLQLLDFIYRFVKNWGWAIIILSILIYFILYPLSLKQMRSMKEMQALQPRIEELRKNYKDNPQKLNKEIMELYKEHKVNPFGGCLPLLLQMPIFFALYQALMRSVSLKGANFLWIKDLSEPDRLFILPTALPILGNEVNLLPILMMIGMFFQQKLSTSTTTGVSSEQQKMMLIIFPLMFGFIFYHMPAGLVLYWFVNSTLMLIYQIKALKVK